MSYKNALHPCFGAVRCELSRKSQLFSSYFLTAIFLTVAPNSIFAAEKMEVCRQSWHQLSDDDFAVVCESMAFSDDLGDREEFSWFVFARVNQLIAERENGGLTGTDLAPIWMTWPTDVDTFSNAEAYNFDATPRVALEPSIEKKNLQAGHIGTADPDAFNEEVTRNRISYNYLVKEGLTTKAGVKDFFESNSFVDMPTGSIELKASWLQVTAGSPAPEGAFTFQFDHGEYWWRGLHIQIKMRSLSDPTDVFYSEEPSWFWSTFEYNGNPGIKNIRENLTTQRAPLSEARIEQILSTVGLAGFGFDRYGPNGTQIRFTVN